MSDFRVYCHNCRGQLFRASLAVGLYHFQLLLESEVSFGRRTVRMIADNVKFDLFLWIKWARTYRHSPQQKAQGVLHLKNVSLWWIFGKCLEESENSPLFCCPVTRVMKEPYFFPTSCWVASTISNWSWARNIASHPNSGAQNKRSSILGTLWEPSAVFSWVFIQQFKMK